MTTPIAIFYSKPEWLERANGRLAPLPHGILPVREITVRLCPLLTDRSILQRWLFRLRGGGGGAGPPARAPPPPPPLPGSLKRFTIKRSEGRKRVQESFSAGMLHEDG